MSQRGTESSSAPGYVSSTSATHDSQGNVIKTETGWQRPGSSSSGYYGGGLPNTTPESRPQQMTPRLLGVHNILNPSEPRATTSEGNTSAPQRSREHHGQEPVTSNPMHPSQHFFPGHRYSGSHPGTPVGPHMSLPAALKSEHPSPTPMFSHHALNNPRRILSPRAPRASSGSHTGTPRDVESISHPQIPPPVTSTKRSFEGDSPDGYRPHPARRQPSSQPHTPHMTGASISRSFSQPIVPPAGTSRPPPPSIPPRDVQGGGSASPGPIHYHPGFHGGRSFFGPLGDAALPWSEGTSRHGTGAPMAAEAQQAFMALPGSDAPIPIHVDYLHASKKADEKRQRNAKASTRHRKKRKAIQEQSARQLQDLKDLTEEMELRMEEISAQRDHYRSDRNRLREIVARTPGIAEHASGPPTPSLSNARVGPYREPSPIDTGRQTTPQREYSSDTSVERLGPLQRTDDRPDRTTTPYGAAPSMPPAGVGPIHGSLYGMPPRPSSATSSVSVGERLPPLRTMDGPLPGLSQPHEQDPRTGQWVPIQPRFETGWATSIPRPGDPSSR